MNGLELMLPSRNLTVNLETYIDAFPRRYFDENDQDYVVFNEEPKVEYLSYKGMGLSFLFKGICLKSVFMYIRGDGYSKFQKRCTYLTDVFWENPSRDVFERMLEGHGFKKWDKENKFVFIMYKDNIYFQYMDRPDASHVTFGSREVFN